MMLLERPCPKCDKKLFYKRKSKFSGACKIGSLCKSCSKKGINNPMHGIPNEQIKIIAKILFQEKGNPFSWESTINKQKENKLWLKSAIKNKGKKRTVETCEKISRALINSYKIGKSKPGNGFKNIPIKMYKGIEYQGTYELNFLKFLESINKLDFIERGPRISYLDINGKERNYFPDYKIKNSNILFEIKSRYYWEKMLETNILKMKSANEQYEYHLIINNIFSHIEYIFNNQITT